MSTVISSANTGVKKLVYAIMTNEATETYGEVKSAPPLINIKAAPSPELAKLYADNEIAESVSSPGDVAIDAELQDIPLEVQADWLGHTLDEDEGTLVCNKDDQAPYVAIGYQRTKGNKKNRYVWFYKVKFMEFAEESATQEDKITFQTPKLVGTAFPNKSGDWKKIADDDTKGSAVTGFLDTVPGSTVPSV